MQFKSESGNQIVDYYEVKDWRNKVSNLTRLKVVTYKGKTVENEAINVFDMAEEIDILLDMNYAVTCNTKRPAQYMSSRTIEEVAQARTQF